MNTDKIYLVGFMCAGKSYLSEKLASRLNWSVEDLDARIEHKEGRSISQIFSESGEQYFRRIEKNMLKSLLTKRQVVVATGGGTFTDATNRSLIENDGLSIWLDVSFETVIKRLSLDGTRPLARKNDELLALWKSRRPAYNLAQLHVESDSSQAGELVDQILNWLES